MDIRENIMRITKNINIDKYLNELEAINNRVEEEYNQLKNKQK